VRGDPLADTGQYFADRPGRHPPTVSQSQRHLAVGRLAGADHRLVPMMLRCTITGRCLAPSAPTYSRPNRSGR
jgi:hypothetical protein